jgi:hypothetical protein
MSCTVRMRKEKTLRLAAAGQAENWKERSRLTIAPVNALRSFLSLIAFNQSVNTPLNSLSGCQSSSKKLSSQNDQNRYVLVLAINFAAFHFSPSTSCSCPRSSFASGSLTQHAHSNRTMSSRHNSSGVRYAR